MEFYYIAIIFALLSNAIFINKVFAQKRNVDTLNRENIALTNSKAHAIEYIDALWISQNETVQNEKQTSLNSLVSGVALELNTPLETSLAGIMHIEKILQQESAKGITEDAEPMVEMTINNIKKSIALLKHFRDISQTELNESLSDA